MWECGAAVLALALGVGCDHGLGPEPAGTAGIAGTVEFVGPWPPQIGEVAVAVYRDHPQTAADFLQLSGYDTGLTLGASPQEYRVDLQGEGVHDWVIAVWRGPDSFWDFTSLLGCYHVAGDSLPSPVAVTAGQVTGGVDITVDFSILSGGARQEWDLCSGALPPELLNEADQ